MKKLYMLFITAMIVMLSGSLIAGNTKGLLDLTDFYDTPPDIANCKAGVLKSVEKQKVLMAVNYIRKIHGLLPVYYDSTYDNQTAQSALIIASNELLNHQPPSSYKCYSTDGYNGSESSNLYMTYNYGNNYPTSESSINQWIMDENVEPCGHRRWLIDPFLKFIAFGRADGPSVKNPQFSVSGMTIYVISNNKADLSNWDSSFVAYPFHQYPKAYFYDASQQYWYLSFTAIMDKSNYWNNQNVTYSSATVQMTDETGNSVSVTNLQSENDGYGVPNLLKWNVANLQPDLRYNVTVKNVNEGGTMKNFSYWFKLVDMPGGDPPSGPPALAQPANNASNLDINPTLTWNAVSDAFFYNVQIATSTDFTQNLIEVDNITALSYIPTLDEKTKYYWRVSSGNQYGNSAWSQYRNFTTKTMPYSKPITLSPADGTGNVTGKTDFIWDIVNGATTYTVNVSTVSDFSTLTLQQKNINDTLWHVNTALLSSVTKYYWRVRAVGMSGASSWSQVLSFWTADFSSVEYYSQGATGILNVYPNPLSGLLSIDYKTNSQSIENMSVAIYNTLGQKVMGIENNFPIDGDYSRTVNIENLPEGAYYLRLVSDKNIISKMITKINK